MIRKKKESQLVVDLDGPNGNAFYLLGLASKLSRQLGLDKMEVMSEMRSGDYNNLLITFNKYFPMVVLETDNLEYLDLLGE